MEQDFLQSTIKQFRYYKQLGDSTFQQVNEAEMHYGPNTASNSIALIIQHLNGNMRSRWTNFLNEDGEKEWRNRDAEFEVQALTKEQLVNIWEAGWKVLLDTLETLQPEDLRKTITIRQEPHSVIDAIQRQLAHYSYHVGQIVYLGRMIRAENWQSLSIPRNGSAAFNRKMMERFGK